MITLIIIKTKNQFLASGYSENSYNPCTNLSNYFFDGIKPIPSFHEKWVIINKIPDNMQIDSPQPNINERYELIDRSLECEKIEGEAWERAPNTHRTASKTLFCLQVF